MSGILHKFISLLAPRIADIRFSRAIRGAELLDIGRTLRKTNILHQSQMAKQICAICQYILGISKAI